MAETVKKKKKTESNFTGHMNVKTTTCHLIYLVIVMGCLSMLVTLSILSSPTHKISTTACLLGFYCGWHKCQLDWW